MLQVMATKLLPPRASGEWVERQRLMELLPPDGKFRIGVLNAPAGYGKTALALQYAAAKNAMLLWYQLDTYDNDPVVFIKHFIAGMRENSPGFGSEVLQLISGRNVDECLRLVVISVVNELAALGDSGLTIVLEDYHVISSPFIHQFVQELLANFPEGVQIIMTSRTMPPLSLSRMQVQGEAIVVNRDVLRFTPEETRDLLKKRQLPHSEELVNSLMAKTEGWPAALKLLSEAFLKKEHSILEWNLDIIYDFMANEILQDKSEADQDFIMAAAVFDTITPEACNRLLDRNDAKSLLEQLEKDQFFLIPLSGENKIYRYHQLFREFLLKRLGTDRTRLYNKAAELALGDNDYEHAINYYAAAGNHNALVSILEKAGMEAFQKRQWQTVGQWMDILSPQMIASSCWLSMFKARVMIYQGRLEESEIWLNKSLTGFIGMADPAGTAQCRFLQAKILNRNGRYLESLELLAQAEPILQKSDPSLRFELTLERALLYIRMGHLIQAEDLLTKGLHVSLQISDNQDNAWVTALFLEGLGNTYYMLGEFDRALEYYQKSAKLSPNGILLNFFADFSGFIYEEKGEMEQAIGYLQNSIAYKEEMGMNEALLPAYYQLGSIFTDIGQLDQADEIHAKAARLIADIGGERFFLLLIKLNDSRNKGAQGAFAESQAILEQILEESAKEPSVVSLICRMYCGMNLLMAGSFEEAEAVLREALDTGIEFAQVLTHCYFLMASIKFATGDLAAAAEYTQKLLHFSARKNFVQIYIFMFEHFQPVLQFGIENNVEVSFVQQVLLHLGERGLPLLAGLAANPDPKVRIRTVFPLSQIGTAASKELLQTLFKDPEQKIRKLAAQCMESEFGAAGTVESELSAAPLLKINMLGPIRILLDNVDITSIKWRFTKSRDLLIYLCHQGRPVGINQILEDLWPAVPMEKAMNQFYSTLHWLRKTIQKDAQPELVKYTSKTCQLNPTCYTTDLQDFIAIINETTFDNPFYLRNLELLEEGIALYQGDYLASLDYPWVVQQREYLKRIHLETRIRMAHLYLKNQEYLKAVHSLEHLVAENPLREEIFGLLMSAYAGLDDRLAVIRTYKQLKSNLDEELGIEPEPEVTRLYYKLCGYRQNELQQVDM